MIEIVEGSQKTSDAIRYFSALQQAEKLEVGQSLLLDSSFEFPAVKAALPSIVGMSLVAIAWDNCTEVQRLPDGFSPSAYYGVDSALSRNFKKEPIKPHSTKPEDVEISNLQKLEISRIVHEFLKNPLNASLKYDKKCSENQIKDKVVSLSYLQRRSLGLAAFRKSGLNNAFFDALNSLIGDELLLELNQAVAFSEYNTKGRMFKVLK